MLSRRVVLKRRLPAEFGGTPLLVSPESTLAYWHRDLAKVDPFLLSMVRELVRPNMMVWDVGANVAIEPDLWLASLMNRSSQLNKLPVTVVPAAVSDRLGISDLHFSPQGRASSSLKGTGPAQAVVTITLDWLLDHFAAPDVLKIDAEGMEYPILRGAQKVLESHPVIFCEVNECYDLVADLLTGADYQFFAARDPDRRPLQRPSRDTLAIPSSLLLKRHL